MSMLMLSNQPTETLRESRHEQNAVLLLAQSANRTALFHDTALERLAKGITQAATRWRHSLSDTDRLVFAQLNAVDAALTAFQRWASPNPDTQASQAFQHCVDKPADRLFLVQLFQVDALLDKWALLKQGQRLFASDTTAQAVIVLAEERVLRQITHEAVGHAAKELEKKGLSLPATTADDARALLAEKITQLFTPTALGLDAKAPD